MSESALRQVSAVLLAGGASRRFGDANKLLAPVSGVPMLRKVANEALAAGITDVVIVTGAEGLRYREALADLPVRFVSNADWQRGIGGSIAAGIRGVVGEADGAFVIPGDLLNLSAAMLQRLLAAFADAGGAAIVVPVTATGEQRNPVLWPRACFSALAALAGEQGGKSLLDKSAARRLDIAFEDASVFADIDTQDDYARFATEIQK